MPSSTSRIEAFSDGVMAIAITLLVLDLRVPTQEQVAAANGDLVAVLGTRWPSYVAYLAAFLTIGIIWLNHHAFIHKLVRMDATLLWLNLLMLLGVATLPFPTALLAEFVGDGGRPAATAALIYGLLSVATALPWVLMWRHIRDHPELLAHGLGDDHARAELRRASMGPIIYVVAIPLALVAPLLALVFYLAISVIYAISSQGARVGAEASE